MLAESSALFVDVGGTLIHPRHGVGGAYAEVAAGLGVDVEPRQLSRQFGEVFERERLTARAAGRLAYGETPEEATAFWRRVVHEVFRPWSDEPALLDRVFDELFAHFARADAWQAFPDAIPLLGAARARGLPVVIVSNWDARLPEVLAGTGLTEQVDAVIGSYAVGAEKPAAAIFEAALAELPAGTERARVLHVGDSLPEDVRGAEAAGLQAVWLDRKGVGQVGVRSVAALSDLVG